MRCNVLLFAIARERAGRASVELDVLDGSTIMDLKLMLARECPELSPLLPAVRIAMDGAYVTDDQPIRDGAELAVIPPVSGG